MKFTLTLLSFAMAAGIGAQPLSRVATNAFVITRMAEKFHVEPRPVDDTFSVHVFEKMLSQTDGEHLLFTQGDVAQLNEYRYKIDDEIKSKRVGYLSLFTKWCRSALRN